MEFFGQNVIKCGDFLLGEVVLFAGCITYQIQE